MPSYGIKDGLLPILAILLIIVKRSNVAVYEHGTFMHKFTSVATKTVRKKSNIFQTEMVCQLTQTEAIHRGDCQVARFDTRYA